MNQISSVNLVVANTPAGGTLYTQRLLTQCQIPAIAEGIFGSSFEYMHNGLRKYPPLSVEVSGFVAHHLPIMFPIIHQVRNPLKQIPSYMSHKYLEKETYPAHKALPTLLEYEHTQDKYAHFWVEWHKRIEQYAMHTYKLEDIGMGFIQIVSKAVGIPVPIEVAKKALRTTKKNLNRHNTSGIAFSYNDIKDKYLKQEIQELSHHYRYI